LTPLVGSMRLASRLAICVVMLTPAAAQVRLADADDRAAFRAWFTQIADAQFYRRSSDVTDCSALVRHAVREALRAHTPEWLRLAALPPGPVPPDVRRPPAASTEGWPLFLVATSRYAEFADARTIISLNTRPQGRDLGALRPGDLLYFHQQSQQRPDHLMIFIGRSAYEPDGEDWIVYHTGPDEDGPGEVRKVRLGDLLRHPAPRWRPLAENSAFRGVFRLTML
jgi:uncharacterized protein YfaT (DUF1175 family)